MASGTILLLLEPVPLRWHFSGSQGAYKPTHQPEGFKVLSSLPLTGDRCLCAQIHRDIVQLISLGAEKKLSHLYNQLDID